MGNEDSYVQMEEDGRSSPVTLSWAEKVQSSNGGGVPIPEKVLDDGFVKLRMRLEFSNGEKGEPVITIGQEVFEAMNGLWKNCMIVNVLCRHVSIAVINRNLKELWKPRGGGPWWVFGSVF